MNVLKWPSRHINTCCPGSSSVASFTVYWKVHPLPPDHTHVANTRQPAAKSFSRAWSTPPRGTASCKPASWRNQTVLAFVVLHTWLAQPTDVVGEGASLRQEHDDHFYLRDTMSASWWHWKRTCCPFGWWPAQFRRTSTCKLSTHCSRCAYTLVVYWSSIICGMSGVDRRHY